MQLFKKKLSLGLEKRDL